MPLTSGYKRFAKYTTDADATTAAGALDMAMAAIDADFSRSKKGKSERFWRIIATKQNRGHGTAHDCPPIRHPCPRLRLRSAPECLS